MAHTRAKQGGEIGVNGEFYQGGEFLPSSPNTVKGEMKSQKKPYKSTKQEIEPYKWELSPEGKTSLYKQIAGIFGKIINGKMIMTCNEQTLNYFHTTREDVSKLIEMYNQGVRWIDIE